MKAPRQYCIIIALATSTTAGCGWFMGTCGGEARRVTFTSPAPGDKLSGPSVHVEGLLGEDLQGKELQAWLTREGGTADAADAHTLPPSDGEYFHARLPVRAAGRWTLRVALKVPGAGTASGTDVEGEVSFEFTPAPPELAIENRAVLEAGTRGPAPAQATVVVVASELAEVSVLVNGAPAGALVRIGTTERLEVPVVLTAARNTIAVTAQSPAGLRTDVQIEVPVVTEEVPAYCEEVTRAVEAARKSASPRGWTSLERLVAGLKTREGDAFHDCEGVAAALDRAAPLHAELRRLARSGKAADPCQVADLARSLHQSAPLFERGYRDSLAIAERTERRCRRTLVPDGTGGGPQPPPDDPVTQARAQCKRGEAATALTTINSLGADAPPDLVRCAANEYLRQRECGRAGEMFVRVLDDKLAEADRAEVCLKAADSLRCAGAGARATPYYECLLERVAKGTTRHGGKALAHIVESYHESVADRATACDWLRRSCARSDQARCKVMTAGCPAPVSDPPARPQLPTPGPTPTVEPRQSAPAATPMPVYSPGPSPSPAGSRGTLAVTLSDSRGEVYFRRGPDGSERRLTASKRLPAGTYTVTMRCPKVPRNIPTVRDDVVVEPDKLTSVTMPDCEINPNVGVRVQPPEARLTLGGEAETGKRGLYQFRRDDPRFETVSDIEVSAAGRASFRGSIRIKKIADSVSIYLPLSTAVEHYEAGLRARADDNVPVAIREFDAALSLDAGFCDAMIVAALSYLDDGNLARARAGLARCQSADNDTRDVAVAAYLLAAIDVRAAVEAGTQEALTSAVSALEAVRRQLDDLYEVFPSATDAADDPRDDAAFWLAQAYERLWTLAREANQPPPVSDGWCKKALRQWKSVKDHSDVFDGGRRSTLAGTHAEERARRVAVLREVCR